MHDKSNFLENINEVKFSHDQGFFDKSELIRWLIASLFLISLFAFLHFREVQVDVLELNSFSPKYVVAPVDFDFFDEEASVILKKEMIHDLGEFYKISENEMVQKRIELDQYLIETKKFKIEDNNEINIENIYMSVEILEKALLQERFTDLTTLKKLSEGGFSTEGYQAINLSQGVKDISLPSQTWDYINKKYFSKTLTATPIFSVILDYFKEQTWNLVKDNKVQLILPEKLSHVSAGKRFIDQGEKITPRHVAMLQSMKRVLNDRLQLWNPLTLMGSLLMTLLLAGVAWAFIKNYHRPILMSNRKLFLLVVVMLLTLCLAKATEFFLMTSKDHLIDSVRYPLFAPFGAILICSLMNVEIATFSVGFLTLVMMIGLVFEPQGFVFSNLVTAMVAILSTSFLRRRKDIFIVCVKTWLMAVGIIFSIHLYNNTILSLPVVADILSAAIFMLLTAVLAVGILPLLESSFHIMTDVSLMEYMDPNNDLLRRMTIEAPGTYQHSVLVGNLAEAAALSIGANGLFCRVATLYHDVGKMATPQYFTENQTGEMNIHQLLTPLESAQVIMAHVIEGVALARKEDIPDQIIDIIKEHHGTTLVYYFYREQLEKMGGDKNLVNEKEFRYPGPKPRSKESAIIMIADSFEAASRSLEKINEETLMALINRLVKEKAEDGQFDECLLTFEELDNVKKTLVKTLIAAGHIRVKYPPKDNIKTELVIDEA